MADRSSGRGKAIPVVGLIAVVVLVISLAWFFVMRDSKHPEAMAAAAPQAQTDSDNDISIKVDLPDSVVITP